MSLRDVLANDEDYEGIFEILEAIEIDKADEEDLLYVCLPQLVMY